MFIAVTNPTETTVRELRSFYGENTGDFLFRCCGELCRLLGRIIDNDAGMAEQNKLTEAAREQERKQAKKYKAAIAAVLVLIMLITAAGGYYFHRNAYTVQNWLDRYMPFLEELTTEKETELTTDKDGYAFYTVISESQTAIGE